jgi:hypothetical protein
MPAVTMPDSLMMTGGAMQGRVQGGIRVHTEGFVAVVDQVLGAVSLKTSICCSNSAATASL